MEFSGLCKNGKLIVDANGTSTATVDFKHDEWIKLKMIVDIDDDFATLYIDSNEVVSYSWSKGTSGAGTTKNLMVLISTDGMTMGQEHQDIILMISNLTHFLHLKLRSTSQPTWMERMCMFLGYSKL